jgi:hypothetical protein
LGHLSLKFLNHPCSPPIPAILLKLDPSNWAILTPCPEAFASVLPQENFAIHVEKAVFTATKAVEEEKEGDIQELKQVGLKVTLDG